MKPTDSHQNQNTEHTDPTWKLLGNASKKIPSGSFTQDLVQSVWLETEQEEVSWWQKPAWKVGFISAAAACIVAIAAIQFTPFQSDGSNTALSQIETPSEQADEAVNTDDSLSTDLDELDYRNQLLASIAQPSELDDQDFFELLVL